MNIIDRLDEYLLDGSSRERRSHHPSDVTSCLRQLYYKWNNVEQSDPPSAGNVLKMKAGAWAETVVEEWLQWEMERDAVVGFLTQNEVHGIEPDLGYPIHGYEDFIVETHNQTFGIEVKSSFGRGIKEVQQSGPKPEHVLQVYQYMRYGDMSHYYIVYIARDSGYRTQFELRYNKDDELYIDGVYYPVDWPYHLRRLIAAEHTIGAAVEPEREYEVVIKDGEIKDKVQRNGEMYKSMWNCRYCAWKSLCHKGALDYSRNTGKILYNNTEI